MRHLRLHLRHVRHHRLLPTEELAGPAQVAKPRGLRRVAPGLRQVRRDQVARHYPGAVVHRLSLRLQATPEDQDPERVPAKDFLALRHLQERSDSAADVDPRLLLRQVQGRFSVRALGGGTVGAAYADGAQFRHPKRQRHRRFPRDGTHSRLEHLRAAHGRRLGQRRHRQGVR